MVLSVTKDINLGTLVPIAIWAFGLTTGAIWWAAHQNAEMQEVRAWQLRQDSRIESLELTQDTIVSQNARIEVTLEVLRQELNENSELILDEIRGDN